MLGRKGEMATVLLVIMSLILVAAALLSFNVNSSKEIAFIEDPNFLNSVYLSENSIEFYSSQIGEKALVNSYIDVVKGQDKILFTIGRRNQLNNRLKEKFLEEFNIGAASYDFQNENLINVFKKDFETILIDDENIILEIYSGGEIEKPLVSSVTETVDHKRRKGLGFIPLNSFERVTLERAKVNYWPVIEMKFNFEKIGLHSFDKIYYVSENCVFSRDNSEIKNCIAEELNNFEVIVSDSGENKFVSLTSKKEFFVDGEFRKVTFNFLLR